MRRERHLPIASVLIGAGLGAAAMSLLDPSRGRRRRALLADKSRHFTNLVTEGAGKVSRDARNRLTGARHRAVSLVHSDHASDEVLADRIRTSLGRVTSRPRSIEVEVENGVTRLRGEVPGWQQRRVMRQVRRVPGVRGVENHLQTMNEDATGSRVPTAWRSRLFGGGGNPNGEGNGYRSWSPTTRATTALAGAAAIVWAARNRSPLGAAAGLTGAALLARGVTNRSLGTVIGAHRDAGEALRIRKTIRIAAPVERVFRLWSHPELFGRFLTHIDRVERLGDHRYRWVAAMPGGAQVTWESELTDIEPDRRISWRSVEGSTVKTEGTVHFEPDDGDTRVHVDMRYTPPGGLLGHSVARLTRQDPRTAMNDDLVRLKSLLEDGKTSVRGQEVVLDEILAEV